MSDRPNGDAISPDTMAALGAELGRMRNWQLWLIEMTPTDIWPADVGPGNLTEEFGSLLRTRLATRELLT